MRYIVPIIQGVLLGLIIGLGILFIGDSVSPTPARIADIIETPVGLLTKGVCFVIGENANTMKWFMLFHFTYWAILGVPIWLGYRALRRKITGDE